MEAVTAVLSVIHLAVHFLSSPICASVLRITAQVVEAWGNSPCSSFSLRHLADGFPFVFSDTDAIFFYIQSFTLQTHVYECLQPQAKSFLCFCDRVGQQGRKKRLGIRCKVHIKYNVGKKVTTGIMKACLKYFRCTGWYLNLWCLTRLLLHATDDMQTIRSQ